MSSRKSLTSSLPEPVSHSCVLVAWPSVLHQVLEFFPLVRPWSLQICLANDCPGVFIFASGFGSRVSALGLISYWISADAKATLYASIVVLESLGHAVGDPLMAYIFASSMQLSPFWTAMPFFFAAVSTYYFYGSLNLANCEQLLYFVAMITTSFVRVDKDGDDDSEGSMHQD